MTTAFRYDLSCYLEGLRVPISGVTVQVNFDAPSVCVADLIPTASCTQLLPRTSIEVYFRDRTDPQSVERLLFLGEIVKHRISRKSGNLFFQVEAVDDSSYWDTAYQYFVDYGRGSDWLFQQKTSFMGTGVGLFDSVFRDHASVIGGLLRTPSKTYPDLKGLVGGVVHILEAVGGVAGEFRGMNDFFHMAELRRKILAQVSASEADDTSGRIYNHKVFWEWLMGQLGSAGSMVSIRDMVKLLFRYVFHQIAPNPAAKYDADANETKVTTQTQLLSSTSEGKKAESEFKAVLKMLDSLDTQLDNHFGAIVKGYEELKVLRGRARTAREHAVRASLAETHRYLSILAGGHMIRLEKRLGPVFASSSRLRNTGNRLALDNAVKAVRTLLAALPVLPSTMLSPLWGETAFRVACKTPADIELTLDNQSKVRIVAPSPEKRLRTHIDILRKELHALLGLLGVRITTKRTSRPRERLHNQIIRPDIWFAPPPRCNVIFPDDLVSFDYGRSFGQEVTRMELTTAMALIGSNAITNSRYVAPNIEDITKKHTLSSSKSGVRLLLPHEIFMGILPNFQFMSDGDIYAAVADQKRAEADEAKQLREEARILEEKIQGLRAVNEQSDEDKALLEEYQKKKDRLEGRAKAIDSGGIPYIQRAVNFLYYKMRFGARQASVTTVFNPRLVMGFPCLVMQRPSPQYDKEPPQYLGMVSGLMHICNQETATTQLTLTEVREHRGEEDDTFGIEGQTIHSAPKAFRKTTSLVLAELERDRNSKDSAKRGGVETSLAFLLDFEERRRKGLPSKGMKGPLGGRVEEVHSFGARRASSLSTTPGHTFAPRYRITEVFSSRATTIQLPFEEQVFPSWMSPVYRNENLGKTELRNGRPGPYMQFLGCRSITDDDTVSPNASNTTLAPSKTTKEAVQELLKTYETLRTKQGTDLRAWADAYTHRPIAEREEIQGTDGLSISQTGEVAGGVAGFHTLAHGPYENLEGLPTGAKTSSDGKTVQSEVAKRLDTRKKKFDAVLRYLEELDRGQGQMGG